MEVTVRAFDGSLAHAAGVLSVEKATFNESPYSAKEVRALLTAGPQRAWLALEGSSVVGFVIAFLTTGLRGSWWEIDLLAVHPTWRGRRLADRLIQAAMAFGSGLAWQARAVVADDNNASKRSFARAGFRAAPGTCNLLICRPQEHPCQPRPVAHVVVREESRSTLTLLSAEWAGMPAGNAELIEVQTLLYHGVWIESLQAPTRVAREALIQRGVNRAREAELDEIGAMAPSSDRRLQQALRVAGFRSLGEFRWLTAPLPLPGPEFSTELRAAGRGLITGGQQPAANEQVSAEQIEG